MKGDFTRFTFQPNKQYTSVLMQQGRLQLDADWNEQMSILTYLNQTQIQDMIGAAAGSPRQKDGKRDQEGFKIFATPDGKDLIIQPGSYYVGGLLCKLNHGSKVSAIQIDSKTLQIPFDEIDGQPFAADQWIEIVSTKNLLKIEEVLNTKTAQSIIQLKLEIENDRNLPTSEPGSVIEFRRITTYKTQPNNPDPKSPEQSKNHLIYLDVWQRHITAIEDPNIRESALAEVPDTTTRIKTIWQVKLAAIAPDEKKPNENKKKISEELLPKTISGTLTVQRSKQPVGISGSGLENQLYRVEIHNGGDLKQARFKWSRDNAIAVSVIKEINAQESAIVIAQLSRDPSRLFKAGQWVEVIDEVRELNQRPGTLARLKNVVNQSGVRLLFDPSTVVGDPIDREHFEKKHSPKIRRWDWERREAGLPLTSPDSEGWIELENGIEVKFDLPKDGQFQTGDYWLIPTRMDDLKPIEWEQDQSGNSLPKKPFGITHYYAALAVSNPSEDPETTFPISKEYWMGIGDDGADQRQTFPPLIDCIDSKDFSPEVLGVGIKPPLARLHVAGSVAKSDSSIPVFVSANSTSVSGNQFQDKLHPGDVLTVGSESRVIIAVQNNTLTLLDPFPTTTPSAFLNYQQPVARLDSGDKIQLILNALGDVGVGTFKPSAKLEVQASDRNATVLHVKDPKDKSLFVVQTDGKVGIGADKPEHILHVKDADKSLLVVQTDGKVGIGTDKPEHNLEIKGNLKASISENGFLNIQPQENQPVLFETNEGFDFNQKITVSNGGISVKGGATLENGVTITNGISLSSGDLTIATGKLTLPQAGEIHSAQTLSLDCSDQLTLKAKTIDIEGSLKLKALELEKLQIDQGVGVGIEAPTNGNLHTKGHLRLGTTTTEMVTLEPPTKNNPVKLTTTNGATGFEFDKGITITSGNLTLNSGSLNFGNKTPAPVSISISDSTLFFKAKNENSMVIDNGNVGIGVNLPRQKLEVAGDTSIIGSVGNGTDNPNATLHIQAANGQSEIVRLTDSTSHTRLSIKIIKSGKGILLEGEDGGFVEVKPELRTPELRANVTTPSSRSLKENVTTLSNQEAQEVIQGLNPVKFTYKADQTQTLHWGFIAEDVPELLASADKQAISPVDIVAALTQLVKEHQDTIVSLAQLLQKQGQTIARLEQKIQRLEENDW